MVVKCENVRIPWNVMDFGSITNGEIKINVINAHVRTVLEVIRSRISHHILQKVVSLTHCVHCDRQLSMFNAFDPVSLIRQCLDIGRYL